jgi:hypothetical protein
MCDNVEYTEYNGGFYFGSLDNPHLMLYTIKDPEITELIVHESTKIVYSYSLKNCINLETIQVPIDDVMRWEEMLNTFKLNDESVRRTKKIRIVGVGNSKFKQINNFDELLSKKIDNDSKLVYINKLTDAGAIRLFSNTNLNKLFDYLGKNSYKLSEKITNNWNSEFTGIHRNGERLFVDLYVQNGKTDRDIVDYAQDFFKNDSYRYLTSEFNTRWSVENIAIAIRTILKEILIK